MKYFSRSELRYAVLLLLLLVLAAIACLRTLTYMEGRILALDYQRAEERLRDYLVFESQRMIDMLEVALDDLPPLEQPLHAYLGGVMQSAQNAEMHLMCAAVLAPDGTLLDISFSDKWSKRVRDKGKSLLAWAYITDAVKDLNNSSVGYARTALGQALIAQAPIPVEDGRAALLLLRPLDRDYIKQIQQTYPAFKGMALPTEEVRGSQNIPIRDLMGKVIGAFIINIDFAQARQTIRSIALLIYALTMSFLFLAGGLGLWAIRFNAVIEGRRRVGRFVDAMDYLPDGMLLLDRKTRAEGINPSAVELSEGRAKKGTRLGDIFPSLSHEEVASLMMTSRPHEVEKTITTSSRKQIWRFRSQPVEGMNLLMISDVTSRKAQEIRQRQIASLHVIGRIARGVAHDFNNILCAVSGHAALISAADIPDGEKESVQAIIDESERGATLAAHLLELSKTGDEDQPAEHIDRVIGQAVDLLKVGLSFGWRVELDIKGAFPPVNLSSIQLEQVLVNLGLLVADECESESTLNIAVAHPSSEALLNVNPESAAIVMIWVDSSPDNKLDMDEDLTVSPPNQYGGVIQSVVRSMLEEVDGTLDTFLRGSSHVYRVCLPKCTVSTDSVLLRSSGGSSSRSKYYYMRGWQVVLACAVDSNIADLQHLLERHGAGIKVAGNLVEALDIVNTQARCSMIAYDMNLLGEDAKGLLRATLKLHPHAGLLALYQSKDDIIDALEQRIEFASIDAMADELLEAMASAWGKAKSPPLSS